MISGVTVPTLITHDRIELITPKVGKIFLLIPLKAALRHPVGPSFGHRLRVVMQVLLISALHLSVLTLVVFGHLIVLDIVVNLILD